MTTTPGDQQGSTPTGRRSSTRRAGTRTHAEGGTPEAEDPRPTPGPQAPAGSVRAVGWTPVCPFERLQPERGVAALVGGEPVAVFRTRDDRLHALHNVDPFSRTSVLCRGIVGDLGATPVVASPLHKQHFALETGTAVEDDTVAVVTYPVRVVDGVVEVGSP